jgi:acyl-CoA synthetase (NDP forming)
VPVLRGAVEAFTAIAAVGRWEGRHEQRRAGEPLRTAWPALAADRTLYGHDTTAKPLLGPTPAERASTATALPELESLARLAAAGIPVVRLERAATADEAAAAADAVGYPVVLKVDGVGLAHKTDIGAVRLGLRDASELLEAAQDLLTLPLPDGAIRRGLLVMPQLDGRELILGARRDPSFGPLVLVGLGGILAEAIDDVAIRLAPVSPTGAEAMLDGLHGRRILGPLRGQPGIDRASVVDAVVRLSDLIVASPDILEIDINPLISGPRGTAAADALIVVGTP